VARYGVIRFTTLSAKVARKVNLPRSASSWVQDADRDRCVDWQLTHHDTAIADQRRRVPMPVIPRPRIIAAITPDVTVPVFANTIGVPQRCDGGHAGLSLPKPDLRFRLGPFFAIADAA